MTDHWKTEIAHIVYWKQIAADHDKKHVLPWHLPRVGAKKEDIELAEAEVAVSFPLQFREFLSYADGWQGFHILTDLFGTQEFLGGRAKAVRQRPELTAFFESTKLSQTDVVPIGASDFDSDIFLLCSQNSKTLPGGVIWFANEEVDRYTSFAEFFSAMVNYNARIAQKMSENS